MKKRERFSRLRAPGSRLLALIFSGVCLGLAVQTYHTGRMVPIIGAVLALLLLLDNPRRWRGWLGGVAIVVLSATLVLGPLIGYALDRPGAFNDRVSDVFLLSESAREGRAPLTMLDETLRRHLLMFHVEGDLNGRHHAPGAPMLDFVTGLGLLAGCGVLLRRWRDWRSLFLFAALALSLVPSALAVDAPHAMRSIGAVAFACIIAALGWSEVARLMIAGRWTMDAGRQTADRGPSSLVARHSSLVTALLSVVVLLALGLNYWLYFVQMPVDPAVWKAFYPVQTRIATYLRDLADSEGDDALRQVYTYADMERDPVFLYLAYGLRPAFFDDYNLSRPVEPGAVFLLGGYTYQTDVERLARYLGPAPRVTLRGPPFPGMETPAFLGFSAP